MFSEFLEAHGQENILKDIVELDKVEELSTQEQTNEEEPTNKIANAAISDFEVCLLCKRLCTNIYKLCDNLLF